MLEPKTDKEVELIVKNVLSACKDIEKLNRRGYDYLYLASGFIAHYNLGGFIEYYTRCNLKSDILDFKNSNRYDNFRPGERDYEYYHQKAVIYQKIVDALESDTTLTELKEYSDVPDAIKIKIDRRMEQNILARYNKPAFHDQQIIHETLAEYGYKLTEGLK